MLTRESYWIACMLFICITTSTLVLSQKLTAQPDISKEGDSLLNCGEMSNLSDITRCLTNRFASVRHKAAPDAPASGNYGYPFRIAPALPAFLRHEADHPPSENSIDGARRRNDQPIQRRMQGYTQPKYRNFLDLDSTVTHHAVEYRPVFQVYHSVPDDPYYGPPAHTSNYYPKPVKTHNKEYARRRKQGKVDVATPSSRGLYQQTRYHRLGESNQPKNLVDGKKHYPKAPQYKYKSGFIADSQHIKENNYDTEYYVPANSPIMGDIRRSLMDYTGAKDLMDDEPDYLSNVGIRRFRLTEIQQDYYPFRRSDTNIKDLVMHESKTHNVPTKSIQ